MNVRLTPQQARVLGSLIEKELTTPDYYPLSLHALTAACNQKSNRDPVMTLTEHDVQAALDQLARQNLAGPRNDFSSRVAKYAHRLSGTLTRAVDFSRAELAVLGELLLRGPQTPGELRARAARMHEFTGLDQVTDVLTALAVRDDPVVAELPKQVGRRESRYVCTWLESPAVEPVEQEQEPTVPPPAAEYERRLHALEEQVAALAAVVRELQARLGS